MKAKIFLLILLLNFLYYAQARNEEFTTDEIKPELIDSINADTIIIKDTLFKDSIIEERPEAQYDSVVYQLKKSTLHIPIDINIAFLEKLINDNFTGLIYEDNNIEDDSLMVKAWKEENFKITYENNELTYQVPIKLWIKKRFDLGLTTTDREIEASIKMDFKSKIGFSKKWNIVSQTDIIGYSWIKKPTMKVMGIDVPITYFVEKIIKDYQTDIGKLIDKTICNYIPLMDYINEIWLKVQDPIDISTTGYNAWIKTTPIQLYMTPLVGKYGIMRTTIGVQCMMEVYMGKIPTVLKKQTELPPFKLYKSTDESFLIYILADVPYDVIDSSAKSILIGEKFGEGKHEIAIDSIEIYGQNSQLIIGLDVSGFINGTIFLTGVPYYEKESHSIRISEVDYRIDTKNILAKIVNLFYKKGLKRKLEEELKFSLKDEFFLVKDMSRSELFNMEIVKNVQLNGYIENLDVEKIFLTETGLKIGLTIGGKLRIKVE